MAEQTTPTLAPWIAYGTWVSTSDGPLIADCDTDANADLIAAAPDLLAACALAIDRPGWQPIPEDERDIIRAALAKARGEA